MRSFLIAVIFLTSSMQAHSQLGVGMAFGNELYQSFTNELAGMENNPTSVLLSPHFGPKLFIGSQSLSVSLHAGVGISTFAFDWKEYKGMGVVYSPLLVSLNYGGMSGFTEEQSSWGASLSGGYLFSLSDIYFRKDDVDGDEFKVHQLPTLRLSGGFGGKGASVYGYIGYGLGSDINGYFSVGIGLEVNFSQRKNYR